MDPESPHTIPSDKYDLFCDPLNPNTLVMLKNIEYMKYLTS